MSCESRSSACLAVPVKGYWEPDSGSLRGMCWRGQTIQGYDFDRLYAEEYYPYHAENDTIGKVLQRKREIKAELWEQSISGKLGFLYVSGCPYSQGRRYPTLSEVPRISKKGTVKSGISKANAPITKI